MLLPHVQILLRVQTVQRVLKVQLDLVILWLVLSQSTAHTYSETLRRQLYPHHESAGVGSVDHDVHIE